LYLTKKRSSIILIFVIWIEESKIQMYIDEMDEPVLLSVNYFKGTSLVSVG
jgi:hypothetical protein